MHRVSAADGCGGGGRRRARERAGAPARARLRRLRRPLREPDARARPAAGGRRARDGAPVHPRPSNSLLQGGDGRPRRLAGGAAGRALHAAQSGRSRRSRAGRNSGRVCAGRGRRAAGVALGHDADAAGAWAARGRLRGGSVPRRRGAVRHRRRGIGLVEGARLRRRRLRARPRHRRHRLAAGPRGPCARGRGEGGRPILALRTSAADARGRHQGVSHHARAVLDLALGELLVAREEDGEGWEEACAGLPLSHMGRGPVEDPAFFRAAYAAGIAARRLL